MIYSRTRPIKIVMLGGSGGYVAPHVYRLLHTLQRPVRFIIADGDIIEQKNLVRQNFVEDDLGRNKAQVLAERYASAFGMKIEFIPEFIEEDERLQNLIHHDDYVSSTVEKELCILIGSVDNNKSRQMCHRVFQKTQELIYIDSGNGEYTGQVVCGLRRKDRTYYKPVGELYPDIFLENDKFPTELSCAEAAISAPQSITANIMAATAIVSYLYNILILGRIDVRSVTFSTQTINLKPVISKKTSARCKTFFFLERKKQRTFTENYVFGRKTVDFCHKSVAFE